MKQRIRALVPTITALMFCLPILQAQTLTTLFNFENTGRNPIGGLIKGSDGDFYGTTAQFASSGATNGTVFKVTSAGALTTLASLPAGQFSWAGLVEGDDGHFYGTTYIGGAGNKGTVFKMTPAGTLTTLVSFTETNGASPLAPLVEGSDGNFYGTTLDGGASNSGTVFKMTPAGELTTLVSFTGSDGREPDAGLVQASDGNFYGTTSRGGLNDFGTVFKVTSAGVLTTLVSFAGTNGINPQAEMLLGSDGNFYGTTQGGGEAGCCGTVFKMTPAGNLTTLHSFTPMGSFTVTNGSSPYAALMQASDGNLYGTTWSGGDYDHGTVFKITPAGAFTKLVSFTHTNGSAPLGGLVQGSDGALYGTTSGGGSLGGGTVYKISINGSPGIAQHLVGRWSFEEGAGTVVKDSSGLGNHGTLVNAKPGTWGSGKYQGGLYLDGSTGSGSTYIRIEDNASLRLSTGATFTAWVRCDDLNRDAPIFVKEGDGKLSYWFGTFGLAKFGVLFDLDGNQPWTIFDRDNGSVPQSQWVHVASTWDGTTIRHYQDGVQVDQTAFAGTINASDSPLIIGANFPYNNTAYRGTLDELSIYSATLSSNEIQVLYLHQSPSITQHPTNQTVALGMNATFSVAAAGTGPLSYQWRKGTNNLPNQTNATLVLTGVQWTDAVAYSVQVSNIAGTAFSSTAMLTIDAPPMLIGHWNFDEGAGGVVSDSSSISNHGTMVNPKTNVWVPGMHQGGLYFDGTTGTNAAYIRIEDNSSLRLSTGATFMAWVRCEDINRDAPIFVKEGDGKLSYWFGNFGSAKFGVLFDLDGNQPWTIEDRNNGSVPQSQWVHLASTWDGTTIRHYQNGVEVDQTAFTGTLNASDSPLIIGSNFPYNFTAFKGTLDEVRLYNYALTPSGVQALYVSTPPSITQHPTNQTVVAGTNVTFSVTASGSPLFYQWRKGISNLADQTNATLVLNNVQSSDAGTYSVVVTNVAGTVTSANAVLTVNVPPSITQHPTNQTVVVGANVTFSVMATGTAPFFYQWRKGISNLADQTNATLVLNNVQSSDAGTYSVVVTNVAGTVTSANAVLTVNVPPSITQHPTNQTVVVGANVTFSVAATGTAPLFYQWHKGISLLGDQTNATLVLNNVQSSDAGTYSVVVTNVAGTVTSANAVLTVNVPPSITQHPTNQTVVVGANVTFSVAATGTAPLFYQWRKGISPLTDQTNATLVLNNVQSSDAGTYSAVVTNVAGTVTSANAVLTVNVPPSITQHPTNQTVVAGTNVTFSVTATGTAPLVYQWRKGASHLADQTNATLFLNNVQSSDAGAYSVVVTNVAGTVTSADAALTVNVPPSITQHPTNQAVVVGANVTFSVTAGGTAPLNYQWRKGTSDLADQTNATLVINDVQFEDAGTYSVLVTNTAGSVISSNAVLTVSLPSTLVGHWKFNEGTGGVISDSSPLGNHGTLVNPKPNMWVAGVHQGGLYFDGTTGSGASYIRIEDNASLRLSTGATFTAWVRCDDLNRDAPIFVKEGDGKLSYWFGTFGLAKFGVLFDLDGNQPWTIEDRDNGSVPQSQWVHLASTWDGTTIRHYQNGVQVDQTAFAGTINASDSPLIIGSNFPYNNTAFKGTLDEIHIYHNALSPAEIRSLYATVATPRFLNQGIGFSDNQFGFTIQGYVGQTVVVEGSTNLVSWLPLSTNILGNETLFFSDPGSSNAPTRYYRLSSP